MISEQRTATMNQFVLVCVNLPPRQGQPPDLSQSMCPLFGGSTRSLYWALRQLDTAQVRHLSCPTECVCVCVQSSKAAKKIPRMCDSNNLTQSRKMQGTIKPIVVY